MIPSAASSHAVAGVEVTIKAGFADCYAKRHQIPAFPEFVIKPVLSVAFEGMTRRPKCPGIDWHLTIC